MWAAPPPCACMGGGVKHGCCCASSLWHGTQQPPTRCLMPHASPADAAAVQVPALHARKVCVLPGEPAATRDGARADAPEAARPATARRGGWLVCCGCLFSLVRRAAHQHAPKAARPAASIGVGGAHWWVGSLGGPGLRRPGATRVHCASRAGGCQMRHPGGPLHTPRTSLSPTSPTRSPSACPQIVGPIQVARRSDMDMNGHVNNVRRLR